MSALLAQAQQVQQQLMEAQEALANSYRHAGAKRATVRLVGRDHSVHLMIGDDGIGFDAADRRIR